VPDSSESTDTNSTNTCEDPVLCNSSDPVAAPVAATAAAQPEKGAATLPDTGAPSGTGELALLGFGLVGAGLVLLRRRPARHRG
jgi:LPXTG-motif cell wall-anchored protein